MRYKVYSTTGELVRTRATRDEAAKLLDIAPEELDWAIEEVGRCDSETYTAVNSRRRKWPGPYNPEVEGPF